MSMMDTTQLLPGEASLEETARAQGERSALVMFHAVKRHRVLAAAVVGTALVASLIVANLLPVTYTADSLVLVNPNKAQVTNFDNLAIGGVVASDPSFVRSELNILQSRAIAGRVVDALDLTSDPEFNPVLNKQRIPFGLAIEARWTWLVDSLKTGEMQPFDDPSEAQGDPKSLRARALTISRLMSKFTAENDGRSYSIGLAITSTDPAKAAKIANAFADQYLKSQIDGKAAATQRANEWLGTRVAELRREVQQADQQIQQFRDQNNLARIEPNAPTEASQQAREMSTQLITAETALAAAQAKLSRARDQVHSNGGVSIPEVLASPIVQNLKQEQAALSRRMAELSQSYGDKHPVMKNAHAQLGDLNQKIETETNKVIAGMADDVRSVQLRVDNLRARLREFQSNVHTSDRVYVRLQELESTAEAKRTLLKMLSERFEQTSAIQNMTQPDAQIVGLAEVPPLPSGPHKLLIVGLSVFASVILVGFIAYGLERAEPGFRAARQVEAVTGLPCVAMVPMLAGRVLRQALTAPRDSAGKPQSRFAEAIRMARGAIFAAQGKKAPQVIVVTSSLPEEGKSMFAAAFARSIVETGKTVLLIDADLRRPRIGELMGLKPGPGLQDVVAHRAFLDDAVHKEADGRLHVLTTGTAAEGEHDIFETEQMWRFLAECCNYYQAVVIDTPPVMIVADASSIARVADAIVYVVQWARTPRETVMAGVQKLRSLSNAMVKLVLSKVDLNEHKKYQFRDEGYYASMYGNYYIGQKRLPTP
jgi:polysaccharide biosynthesis transport protein